MYKSNKAYFPAAKHIQHVKAMEKRYKMNIWGKPTHLQKLTG